MKNSFDKAIEIFEYLHRNVDMLPAISAKIEKMAKTEDPRDLHRFIKDYVSKLPEDYRNARRKGMLSFSEALLGIEKILEGKKAPYKVSSAHSPMLTGSKVINISLDMDGYFKDQKTSPSLCHGCGAPIKKGKRKCEFCDSEIFSPSDSIEELVEIIKGEETIPCPRCADKNTIKNENMELFCKSCNFKILMRCPLCSGIHPHDAVFCQKTGRSIEEGTKELQQIEKYREELRKVQETKAVIIANRPVGKVPAIIGAIVLFPFFFLAWIIIVGTLVEYLKPAGDCVIALSTLLITPLALGWLYVQILLLVFPFFRNLQKFKKEMPKLQMMEDQLTFQVQNLKQYPSHKKCKHCGQPVIIGSLKCNYCKKELI